MVKNRFKLSLVFLLVLSLVFLIAAVISQVLAQEVTPLAKVPEVGEASGGAGETTIKEKYKPKTCQYSDTQEYDPDCCNAYPDLCQAQQSTNGQTASPRQFTHPEAKEAYDNILAALNSGKITSSNLGCGDACKDTDPASIMREKVGEEHILCNKPCENRGDESACRDKCYQIYGPIYNEIDNSRQYAMDDYYLAKSQEAAKKSAEEEKIKSAQESKSKIPQKSSETSRNSPSNEQQTNNEQKTGSANDLQSKIKILKEHATKITANQVTDSFGNPISPKQLENGLGDSLPYVSIKATVPLDLKSGQTLNVVMPKGGYLGEGLFTLKRDVTNGAVMTINAIDGPSVAKILRGDKAEIDPKIGNKIPAPPKDGNVLQYFEIEIANSKTGEEQAQRDMFQEALFNWHITRQEGKTYDLRHYDEDLKEWKKLANTECKVVIGFNYNQECITDPEGVGYYAIVEEKIPTRLGKGYLIAAILLGILTASAIFAFKYWKAAKVRK
ncbi:MAG: hypothetical protein Q8R04_02365 [Nanoarchaeota archaeon]|nr:hypothetical protein [Nanoarchaeota archaeon]